MKRLLILLILIFILINSLYAIDINMNSYLNKLNFNIKCDQILKKSKFEICYSYSEKHPILTIHELKSSWLENSKHYSRKHLSFKPDYSIPRKYRSYSNDYTHSGYDRGHNVPNADFNWNKKYQKETFLMSNVSPQAKWLNRKYWQKIERFERYITIKNNKSIIITGSCGNKGYLKNHVGIPKYWFKIIISKNKIISFLAPNTNYKMKKARLRRYLSSINEIKKVCHF